MRLESARLENVKARLGNVNARLRTVKLKKSGAQRGTLVNVRARLGDVRPQRSFSESDETRHLQLHLPSPYNRQVGDKAEHQQLHRLWLEDN